jgi:hypothetical protein
MPADREEFGREDPQVGLAWYPTFQRHGHVTRSSRSSAVEDAHRLDFAASDQR